MALPALATLRERIDALSLRERVLVLAAVAALIFTGWQTLFVDRLDARRNAAQDRLASFESDEETAAADTASASLTEALERQHALRNRLVELNAAIADASGTVVTPGQMAAVVQEVLRRKQNLSVIAVRNLAPVPIVAPQGDAASHGPYIHPLEIIVEGDFAGIAAYLQELETLPWKFYWRSFELDASHWPRNRARIELGTMSSTTTWMGNS